MELNSTMGPNHPNLLRKSDPLLGCCFGLIGVLIDTMQVDTRLLSKLNVVLKVISGLGYRWDPKLKPQNDSQGGGLIWVVHTRDTHRRC